MAVLLGNTYNLSHFQSFRFVIIYKVMGKFVHSMINLCPLCKIKISAIKIKLKLFSRPQAKIIHMYCPASQE